MFIVPKFRYRLIDTARWRDRYHELRPSRHCEGATVTLPDGTAGTVVEVSDDDTGRASPHLRWQLLCSLSPRCSGQTFLFAERRGVDLEIIVNMFKVILPHPELQHYMDQIRTRNFSGDAGFSLEGGLKDLQLMLDSAAEARVTLPCANVIRDHCITALAHGMKERDWSTFTEAVRIDAGQN
jgi:3-hydroxyisobutyrate dehydrogenase-like beta-hydroxyacid dehydrogenase